MTTLAAPTIDGDDLKPWVKRFVRLGYGAKGVIYLLIGALALRLAIGAGGRLTDSSGALKTLEDLPAGMALLTAVGAGLLAYAGWEIVEALWDTNRKGTDASGLLSRGLTILKAIVYGGIGFEAVRLIGKGDGGGSSNPDDYARTAMTLPLGGIGLGLVGAGIAVYGVSQLWKAWQAKFDSDLDQRQIRRDGGGWVLKLGRVGIGARGVILTMVGVAVARAGFNHDPSRAGGTREALWSLVAQPYGHWLLGAMAAGLICYGLFQLLHARYARL